MDAENTPRTDAALLRYYGGEPVTFRGITLVVDADFARQLERELSEAKEIISHFGWTSSDSTEVILKAERWLAAQPDKTK